MQAGGPGPTKAGATYPSSAATSGPASRLRPEAQQPSGSGAFFSLSSWGWDARRRRGRYEGEEKGIARILSLSSREAPDIRGFSIFGQAGQ